MPQPSPGGSGASASRLSPAAGATAAAGHARSAAVLPTILFYSLQDAVAALTAAAERRVAIRLQCPFAMTASFGPAVARAMFEAASAEVPAAVAELTIECGDQPGLALAALRSGSSCIAVDLPQLVEQKIIDIAAASSATVTRCRTGADVLDLAGSADSLAACRKRLGEHPLGWCPA